MRKRNQKKPSKPDVVNNFSGGSWIYSKTVKSHFFNPRNFLARDPTPGEFNAEGVVGAAACGDVMRIWLKIDPKTERIKEFRWRTFGCASAIAATSVLSVIVTEKGGMKVDKALKVKPEDITKRLGGLPDRKIHCSVLGEKALRAAIVNWFDKTEQYSRITTKGARVIDPHTKTTEADIEKAVQEGACTLEEVQRRTKVGIGYPKCLPEVEQLIHFYKEKHSNYD